MTADRYGLWQQVGKLLRANLMMTYLGFMRANRRGKIRTVVLLLFALAFVAGVFIISWGFWSLIRSPRISLYVDMNTLIEALPAMVLTTAFFVTVTLAFGVLLQGLYLAGDMEFLLSAPVPIRAVFVTKLLQAILPDLALISLFALPILWGLGAASGFNPAYYVFVFISLATVVFAAAGLSSLLVMGAARLFPPRLVAEVLGLAGGMIALVVSQAGQFARASDMSEVRLSQGLNMLTALNAQWSPLAWAGSGLIDIGTGQWLSGLGLTAAMLALGGGVFFVALVTAERLYYNGWARMVAGSSRKKPAHRRASFVPVRTGVLARVLPAAVRALVLKDALIIRRDLRSLSQLIGPLVLALIYAFLFVRSGGVAPAGRGQAPAVFMRTLTSLFVYGNIAIALFVGWSFISRLSLMSFSQEGKYYWLVKSAPVSANRLLASKFLVAFLPTAAISIALFLGISVLQAASIWPILFGALVVAFCLAGGTGLYLAFGVVGARLDWTDPRRMITTSASCLGGILTGVYMLLDLCLFLGPPIAAAFLALPELPAQLVGLGLGGLMALLCTIGPLLAVRKRVPEIGEG